MNAAKQRVSMYRVRRSGSTMLKRALQILCRVVQSEHDVFVPEARLVVTVRDWRDVCLSHWRIRYAHTHESPTKPQLEAAVRHTRKSLNALNCMCDTYPDFTVWRYERNGRSFDAMAAWAERAQLWRTLTAGEEAELFAICDLDRTLELQASVPCGSEGRPFSYYDKQTTIHSNHIGPHRGQPGAWREVAPEAMHDWLTECFCDDLQRWGYDA